MELLEALNTRMTIRNFKPDPVPRKILEEIITKALRAPSGANSQPWEIWVLGGDTVNKIGDATVASYMSGVEPHPDIPAKPPKGVYLERAIALGKQLYATISLDWFKKEERDLWFNHGYRFFGAPNVIILTWDEIVDYWGALACAFLADHICLVALEYGLGTSLQRAPIDYPENIRRITRVPESKKMVVSIAIGYPDWDHPANKMRTEREPLEKVSTWCGFD